MEVYQCLETRATGQTFSPLRLERMPKPTITTTTHIFVQMPWHLDSSRTDYNTSNGLVIGHLITHTQNISDFRLQASHITYYVLLCTLYHLRVYLCTTFHPGTNFDVTFDHLNLRFSG